EFPLLVHAKVRGELLERIVRPGQPPVVGRVEDLQGALREDPVLLARVNGGLGAGLAASAGQEHGKGGEHPEQDLRVRHRTICKPAGFGQAAPPACRSPSSPGLGGGWRRWGGAPPVTEPACLSSGGPARPRVLSLLPPCGGSRGGCDRRVGIFSRRGRVNDG